MISFIYPYYNNISVVKQLLDHYEYLPHELKKEFQFVLIDDCSDEILDYTYFNQFNLNLIVARIDNDIDWNQSGAHNLGSTLATGDWICMMDIDHHFKYPELESLLKLEKTEKDVFYFPRIYCKNILKEAPNIYLINKKSFWSLGGYDEDFAGNYGYEDKLLQKIIFKKLKTHVIDSIFIEVLNAPTLSLNRDVTINKNLLEEKLKLVKEKKYINGSILRFKWTKILEKVYND